MWAAAEVARNGLLLWVCGPSGMPMFSTPEEPLDEELLPLPHAASSETGSSPARAMPAIRWARMDPPGWGFQAVRYRGGTLSPVPPGVGSVQFGEVLALSGL